MTRFGMDDNKESGERRWFTVAAANAALPEVRRLLGELRQAVSALELIRRRFKVDDGEVEKPPSDTRIDSDHLAAVVLFHRSLSRFNELGIEIKDVGRGLIDFPARAGKSEIRLCWLDGEEAVRFFHDLESGYSGRKPIEELETFASSAAAEDAAVGEAEDGAEDDAEDDAEDESES